MNNQFLNLENLDILENLFEKYKKDPFSVDETSRAYFESLETPHENFKTNSLKTETENEISIQKLIEAYRTYGHLVTKTNPLSEELSTENRKEFDLKNFNLKEEDLKKEFPTCGILKKEIARLEEIVERLETTYTNKIAVEYSHLEDKELKNFIQNELENKEGTKTLTIEDKKEILQDLNRSEILEIFLHTKYVGQKRFSIEGAETLIPMMKALIDEASKKNVDEYYIGMSHRGRLNVLSNILNKSYQDLFSEFDESYIPNSFEGSGDVKYHKGFSSEVITRGDKKVKIHLTPNPSHLESVDSVVQGQVKARQIQKKDHEKETVLPILIHGDAAISGQGIVYEILQFSNLEGYSTGGTIHFIVNNQIGFTTVPKDSRSTRYCTDIAKTFQFPVFHVNGEDPETAVFVTLLALKIRQKFHKDVFIDLVCYRKYGHNETDEPSFTQPLEYKIIRNKRPVRELYLEQLIQEGVLEKKLAEDLEEAFKKELHEAQNKLTKNPNPSKIQSEKNYQFTKTKTGLSKETLIEITKLFTHLPDEFHPHPKVAELQKKRLKMVEDGNRLDWAIAEHLAYASLLIEGVNIRISGQDCCRGTFSQRHGLFVDQKEERDYFPLQHLKKNQGRFDLLNSPLSEFGVLGFEYGYNIVSINDLTIWEAQFGDFANGAQVIIDQYIASAEQKWGQKSSLVMFLPHGYEGQGPEHSSARIERFLTLAADDNMQIVNPTTPSQLFHLLRRQILSKVYKPLIIFTPKGLLRHPECVSPLTSFTEGSFKTLITDELRSEDIKKVIFCSGRVYYDLKEYLTKNGKIEFLVIRIEQLFPFDLQEIQKIMQKHPNVKDYIYVQEEPMNMGAYSYLYPILNGVIPKNRELRYVGRERSASPATGSHALHKIELEKILKDIS